MVFVRKTYVQTRSLAGRAWSAVLFIGGFLALMFLSSARMSLPFSGLDKLPYSSGADGVAYADAPSTYNPGNDGCACLGDDTDAAAGDAASGAGDE